MREASNWWLSWLWWCMQFARPNTALISRVISIVHRGLKHSFTRVVGGCDRQPSARFVIVDKRLPQGLSKQFISPRSCEPSTNKHLICSLVTKHHAIRTRFCAFQASAPDGGCLARAKDSLACLLKICLATLYLAQLIKRRIEGSDRRNTFQDTIPTLLSMFCPWEPDSSRRLSQFAGSSWQQLSLYDHCVERWDG